MPGRIPDSLQQIFLASQKGEDVSKISAPSNGVAFKTHRKGSASRAPKKRIVNAPTTSSLGKDRAQNKSSAADASVKAIKEKKTKQVIDENSPQAYLDKMLEKRGYSTKKFVSLEGGYYCRPTNLQQASYGSRISLGVRSADGVLVKRLLDAGLSPNPCNNYGESLVHMVCRKGFSELLRVFLEAGCSLQVTDDYGRTPLHDAAWRAEPSFEIVQMILDNDKNLINLMDCRGTTPLGYVKKENYAVWIDFLESKLDRFWPTRDLETEGEERPPPLTSRPPHSVPVPDPVHALPLEVAVLVSNGRMEPEEAIYLDDEEEDSDFVKDSDTESESDSDDDDDDDDDSSFGSESSEGSEFDESEFAEICFRAGGPIAIAKKCFGGNVQVVGRSVSRKMA